VLILLNVLAICECCSVFISVLQKCILDSCATITRITG
jgi:hypothetical protein